MSSSTYEANIDPGPGIDVPKNVNPMIELGATGLRRTAGYVDEEFLPQLKGRKAVQIYREMADNDPVIGSLLFSVDRLLRQVDWRVEPASQKDEDKKAAEFVEQCMDDMSTTWDDLITEVLTMLPYGFSWHEIVYKRRVGPWEKDNKKRSRFSDGKIGWRKIPIRAQETFQRWVFDETGGVKAYVQIPPPYYQMITIPIEKSLLFRVSTAKGNPEGRSFLRNAYRPYYMKKRLEEIEAIGAERDLAGLPMARVPSDYLSAAKGTDKAKMVEAFRQMVRSVRRNEQEGVIIPRMVDPDTKMDNFDFALLNSGGGRQFNINEIIQRYEERILMTVLADFILVGHQGTGSYALHTDKTGLFRASMNSISSSIADVFNRYAIPRLFEVNGWKVEQLPRLVPGDIDPPDLTQLSQFMGQLTTAGLQWFPDPELEKFLRDAARLPKLDETSEQVKETEARQANIMRLAQQRLDLIGLSTQAEQGQMGLQQQQMGMEQQAQQMTLAEQQAQEQSNPEVQQAQAAQTVQSGEMDLAAKEQAMRHTEEKHGLTLEQMKAQMQAKQSSEDPRFADQKLKQGDDLHKEKVNQLKFQSKAQQELHSEKVKSMRLKAKTDTNKKPPLPKPKEKK
jgi:phage gp29-like protein